MENFVILHNQIRDSSSLIEHHYEDPCLVNVNRKCSNSFKPTYTNCVICYVGPNLTFND